MRGSRVGSRLRVATPAGEATYRVTGTRPRDRRSAHALLRRPDRPHASPATPDKVNAIAVPKAVDRVHVPLRFATLALNGARGRSTTRSPTPTRAIRAPPTGSRWWRSSGRWAGSAGCVALFVVAGTFSLAIVQRRGEIAVLRALGAAPHQVRRLIAGEALIVSVVAGALGILAGGPLARAIVDVHRRPRRGPAGLRAGHSPGSRSSPRSAAAS